MNDKNKIKNSFDFLRGWEKARVSIFHLRTPGKVCVSPVPNEAGTEIHTIVTYDPETHFDVNKTKFERSVWRESSFEVITFEMQNWKHNFLDI